MKEAVPDFEEVLAVLKKKGVQFVIIGGLAAIYHGHARVTYDIDVCYSRTPRNIEALASALVLLNAKLRKKSDEPNLPFKPDIATLKAGLNFTLTTKHGDLDIMGEVSGIGVYDDCLVGSATGRVAHIEVRILSLDHLISSKKAAGRPKDLDDLRALEAIRAILKNKLKA